MSLQYSPFKVLVNELTTALKSFQSSTARLRIVRTVRSSSTIPGESPKTLLILDSSFNPPSKAHQAILTSALHPDALRNTPPPYRLLLLFSTHNADKAPSAATFDQRLALMTLFAEDVQQTLNSSGSSKSTIEPVDIDIGLTTLPFYTDKSKAIATDGTATYPSNPRHVHLMGFDTITRFFAAKYYPDFSPPLSALAPYFGAGHRLRVTLRPSEEYGSVEEQRDFIDGLGRGDMEKDGGRREWAEHIEMVEAGEGVGVSSTRVRKAAKAERWEEVRELCTERVAEAVIEERIYGDDDRGAKMA